MIKYEGQKTFRTIFFLDKNKYLKSKVIFAYQTTNDIKRILSTENPLVRLDATRVFFFLKTRVLTLVRLSPL